MLFALPIGRIVALLAGIHGTVRSAGEARPVVGLHVELDGIECAVTDTAGRYTVAGLATGSHQLRFLATGYEVRELRVFLADSAELALDVELTRRPMILPPIEIVARTPVPPLRADSASFADRYEAGRYRIAPGWQASQPAGSVDIQGVLARLPGVTARGDNTTALSIHGARGSENSLLLDGIPLFGAVHFAGASSAINPDAIVAMDLHTGVSSARFGGALSGVAELETAEALGTGQVNGGLSTADVRSTVRTSLGSGGGILLGARSSIRNLMSDGSGLGTVNGYQDFLAVGSGAIGPGVLRLIGFESTNHLRWEPAVGIATVTADSRVPAPGDAANWQSNAVGATWTEPVGSDRQWQAAAWWSGTGASIATLATNRTDRLASGFGELGLSTEWRQRYRASTLLFGGELLRPSTSYSTSTLYVQPPSERAGVAIATAQPLGAVYGEWSWLGSALLDVRVGLRGNTDFRHAVALDPRIVVNVRPGAVTRLEIGYGRSHQYLQSMLNEDNLMSAVVGPSLLTGGQAPASSDQWIVSLERRVGNGITAGIDGYARRWRHVLAPAVTTAGFFVASSPVYGDGDARGVDATVTVVRGPFTAQAVAGVASSLQHAAGIAYPSSFDQPWNFSGDLSYRLEPRTTLQLRWTAGAGQPATAVLSGIEWQTYQPATGIGEIEGSPTNLAGAINALRLPAPLRLDLGIRREWPIGGRNRASGITTAVRFQNIFNGANPLGAVAQADGSLQWLRGTPRGVVFEVGWSH